jgi:hypothetical protein
MDDTLEEEQRRSRSEREQETGERKTDAPPNTSERVFVQQLAEAIADLAERRAAAIGAEFSRQVIGQMEEERERNLTAHESAMQRIAESIAELARQGAARGDELDEAQQRAVLKYDAFRSVLGRPGATSMLIGRLVQDDTGDTGGRLVIVSGRQLPGREHRLVAFDSNGTYLFDTQLRRSADPDRDGDREPEWSAKVDGRGSSITHFEVWDKGSPRWFGLMLPHAHDRERSS